MEKKDYSETFATYSKIAEVYEERFMQLSIYDETYHCFILELGKGEKSVLDVACGPGNITAYLHRQRPEWKLTGVDAAEKMIELACKNVPEAHFLVADVRELETGNQQFDGIIAGFFLPYITLEETDEFLSTLNGLLTHNGTIYLSYVDDNPEKSGVKTNQSGDSVHFIYHRISDLSALFDKHGFEMKHIFSIPYPPDKKEQEEHTILILSRKQ